MLAIMSSGRNNFSHVPRFLIKMSRRELDRLSNGSLLECKIVFSSSRGFMEFKNWYGIARKFQLSYGEKAGDFAFRLLPSEESHLDFIEMFDFHIGKEMFDELRIAGHSHKVLYNYRSEDQEPLFQFDLRIRNFKT